MAVVTWYNYKSSSHLYNLLTWPQHSHMTNTNHNYTVHKLIHKMFPVLANKYACMNHIALRWTTTNVHVYMCDHLKQKQSTHQGKIN